MATALLDMSAQFPGQTQTPEWALPLCPNCGSWLQGGDVHLGDTECRVSAAYLIAHGKVSQPAILKQTNGHRAEALPDNWPEPIDWTVVAQIRLPNDEVGEWARRIAQEYSG